MGRWDHNPQVPPTYGLFSFFAEGPCLHVLNLGPLHSLAVTATQLGSNQPHHSHCMRVIIYGYTLCTHIYMYVCIYSLGPQAKGAVGCQPRENVLSTSEGPWFVSLKTFSLSFPGPGDAAHEGLQRGQDADVDNRAVHGGSSALPLEAAGDGHNREVRQLWDELGKSHCLAERSRVTWAAGPMGTSLQRPRIRPKPHSSAP